MTNLELNASETNNNKEQIEFKPNTFPTTISKQFSRSSTDVREEYNPKKDARNVSPMSQQ